MHLKAPSHHNRNNTTNIQTLVALVILAVTSTVLLTNCSELPTIPITSLNPNDLPRQLLQKVSESIGTTKNEPTQKLSGRFFKTEGMFAFLIPGMMPASFDRDSQPIILKDTIIVTTSNYDVICIDKATEKQKWIKHGKHPLSVYQAGNLLLCAYRATIPDICALDPNTGNIVWEYLLGSNNQFANLTDLRIKVQVVKDRLLLISNVGWIDCLDISQGRRLWRNTITNQLPIDSDSLFCADDKSIYLRGYSKPPDAGMPDQDNSEGPIYAIDQKTGKIVWTSQQSFRSDSNPLIATGAFERQPSCILVTTRDLLERYKFERTEKGKKYIPPRIGPATLTIIDTKTGRCSRQELANGYCSPYDGQNQYRAFALNKDQSKLFCWWQTMPKQCHLMVHNLVSSATGFTLTSEKTKSSEFNSPKIAGLLDKKLLISSDGKLICLDQANLKPLWQYDKFEHYNWDTRNNLITVKSANKDLVLLGICPTPNPLPERNYSDLAKLNREQRRKHTHDHHHQHRKVVALDASTGKELWSKQLKCLEWFYTDNAGKVFALTHSGYLSCLDAESGKELWLFTNPLGRRHKRSR